MRKTGPNNVRRVVWAKGMCFFFFRVLLILTHVFFVFLDSIYVIKKQAGLGWLTIMIMGQDDARCIFWTKGMCFFKFYFVFCRYFTKNYSKPQLLPPSTITTTITKTTMKTDNHRHHHHGHHQRLTPITRRRMRTVVTVMTRSWALGMFFVFSLF